MRWLSVLLPARPWWQCRGDLQSFFFFHYVIFLKKIFFSSFWCIGVCWLFVIVNEFLRCFLINLMIKPTDVAFMPVQALPVSNSYSRYSAKCGSYRLVYYQRRWQLVNNQVITSYWSITRWLSIGKPAVVGIDQYHRKYQPVSSQRQTDK